MKSKSSDATRDSLSNDESLVCASDSKQTPNEAATPQHIAIIMDGNNRWAKKRFLPGIRGHKAGVEAIRSVLAVCEKHQVKALTLFAFSSENWQRPVEEVGALMSLFLNYLKREVSSLHKKGVRIRFIGRRDRLQADIVKQMEMAETLTQLNTVSTLVLAVDYGGQWDITNAATEIAKSVAAGDILPEQIDESLVHSHLSLNDLPAPDLCVRTGGEYRISNFILWQLSYAELYFTECFWPDFDEKEMEQAIAAFSARQRRFGKTSEQVVSAQALDPQLSEQS
ncbi:MAG: di-trans,poly-cis-decaprenylcistransferase [Cellvibrionales bacterium]|nr:di-trans,poly-cis-decaprenylcistransferase [Cellvibrionales bacterium]